MTEETRVLEKKLLWSENFHPNETNLLSSATWSHDLGDGTDAGIPGWGNNELEYYTVENSTVNENSELVISASRLDPLTPLKCYYGPALWSSAKIHTGGKVSFHYGYLEITAKMPKGIGTWPALWLLGTSLLSGTTWPDCGEIDIYEGMGSKSKQVQGTIHGPGYAGEFGLTKYFDHESDLSESFHTFAIDWRPDRIEWFFDGNSYQVIEKSDERLAGKDWPYNAPFYLIINLAIGGNLGGYVASDFKSAELVIESIRHYAINGIGEVILA